jgi:hypothetical protein
MIGAIISEPNDEAFKDFMLFLTDEEIELLKSNKLEGKLVDTISKKEHVCSLSVSRDEFNFSAKNDKNKWDFVLGKSQYFNLLADDNTGGRIGGFYKIDIVSKIPASLYEETKGYLAFAERYISTRNA